MLLRMSEEDQDYEGKWPKGGAMTKPTVESVMRMIHDNEFMRNDDARDKIRAAIESLAAPAAPVQQAEPVSEIASHGCHYLAFPDRICNKCGRIHGYSHPPAAEVQRLRDAARDVCEWADAAQWALGNETGVPAAKLDALRRALEGGE